MFLSRVSRPINGRERWLIFTSSGRALRNLCQRRKIFFVVRLDNEKIRWVKPRARACDHLEFRAFDINLHQRVSSVVCLQRIERCYAFTHFAPNEGMDDLKSNGVRAWTAMLSRTPAHVALAARRQNFTRLRQTQEGRRAAECKVAIVGADIEDTVDSV